MKQFITFILVYCPVFMFKDTTQTGNILIVMPADLTACTLYIHVVYGSLNSCDVVDLSPTELMRLIAEQYRQLDESRKEVTTLHKTTCG
jgi:hypothetical protein